MNGLPTLPYPTPTPFSRGREWSLFTRGCEKDLVPVCRELGIGFLAYRRVRAKTLPGSLALLRAAIQARGLLRVGVTYLRKLPLD